MTMHRPSTRDCTIHILSRTDRRTATHGSIHTDAPTRLPKARPIPYLYPKRGSRSRPMERDIDETIGHDPFLALLLIIDQFNTVKMMKTMRMNVTASATRYVFECRTCSSALVLDGFTGISSRHRAQTGHLRGYDLDSVYSVLSWRGGRVFVEIVRLSYG